MDAIRAGIDHTITDGWQTIHYVTIAAIERLGDDGLEIATILFTAQEQANYITEGLLYAAERLNCMEDEDCEE